MSLTLQEVFDQLTAGELSQLNIGGAKDGQIDEDNYGKVVPHINLGLTSLFKRFSLKEGRLIVNLVPGLHSYALTAKHAVVNATVGYTKYLIDSVDSPFVDDILKIERVLTDDGFDLPLNDGQNRYSLETPTSTTLRVPEEIVNGSSDLPSEYKTEQLELVYRANHRKIVVKGGLNPSKVLLDLPESHLEALLYFVASRVNNPLGMTNEFHAGNSYYAKYEKACQDLEDKGLQRDQSNQLDKFRKGGWV